VCSLDFAFSKCDLQHRYAWTKHMPQILTANRLAVGEVVYWNPARGWVPALADASVLPDGEADAALKGAERSIREREVVGAYLFAVRVTEGAVTPVKIREAIRAAGPTVRRDLGKQAG
jgi:hypothetical protein